MLDPMLLFLVNLLAETETWRTLYHLHMIKSSNKLGNVLLHGLKFNSEMRREKEELKSAIEFCKTTYLNATVSYFILSYVCCLCSIMIYYFNNDSIIV